MKHFRLDLAVFVIAKAVAMGVAAVLLDIEFWRALILIAISAVITGSFGLLIGYLQHRSDLATHERLDRLERLAEATHDRITEDDA